MSMNCTQAEFVSKVRGQFPHKHMHIAHSILYNKMVLALDTAGECQLDLNTQLKLASHIWDESNGGVVTKDSNGLFSHVALIPPPTVVNPSLIPGVPLFNMLDPDNCTVDEFERRIDNSFQNVTFWTFLDSNFERCVYEYEVNPDYASISGWTPQERYDKARHVWCNNKVIKDNSGFLIIGGTYRYKATWGGVPAGSGGTGGTATPPNIVSAGPGGITKGHTTFYPIPPSYFGGIDKEKKVEKCECGAHSVGSNKHSSWCGIKENT